jgi:hypothetical protein
MNNKNKRVRMYLDASIKQEIEERSCLWGLIKYEVIINTNKVKDDLVIHLEEGADIDKIWIIDGYSAVKTELTRTI